MTQETIYHKYRSIPENEVTRLTYPHTRRAILNTVNAITYTHSIVLFPQLGYQSLFPYKLVKRRKMTESVDTLKGDEIALGSN